MSRSLAIVGILTIIGVAGSWTAVGQDAASQTTAGSVAKNHISDAERDRLMRKAMEDARLELEQQKAAKQAQEEQKSEIKRRADEAAVLAAETRRKAEQNATAQKAREAAAAKQAAADKKAEEVKLAAKLADDEKQTSAEAAAKAEDDRKKATAEAAAKLAEDDSKKASAKAQPDVKDLDKVEAKADGNTPSESAKNETVVTSSKETRSQSEDSKSFYKEESDKAPDPERTTIETVSTREPGSGISVKTSMPVGDEERKAEQAAARTRSGQPERDPPRSSGSERRSLSGQVVGMMRSSDGKPRILLNTDDSRMIQVIMEDSNEDVPAPGAYISVKGREIGGADGRPVISALSISVTRGEAMKQPEVAPAQPEIYTPIEVQVPEAMVPRHVTEAQFGLPAGPIVMPPPFGLMPPPMPMMHGGPMFGPPPPF